MFKHFFVLFFIAGISSLATAQTCTTLGQTPETAFPVCGTSTFTQNNVPICRTQDLYVPGCDDGADYANKNPFWYRFTCYQAGTLSFLITPKDLGDDYDWQLYDITGLPASAVFTNRNIIVSGNWSGSYGTTGANAGGVTFIQCASNPADNKPRFARSPNLIVGHTYILLISHFTDSQSGYDLDFSGGTAVITDPKLPKLDTAKVPCDASEISITLNKEMKCRSIDSDGSGFSINTTLATITGASSAACSSSFDSKSLILSLSNPLPPGTYTIKAKLGGDLNTILDNCDRQVPVGDSLTFVVVPISPLFMDSIMPVKCAPDSLVLVFRKEIKCNSVSADGSEFRLTGPEAATITSATGQACSADGLSTKIVLKLSKPLQVGGTYTVTMQAGSDGNTVIGSCGEIIAATGTASVAVADTVNADFTFNILLGCAENVVQYNHPAGNNVNNWLWSFDQNSIVKTEQNPIIRYTNYRVKNTFLTVSNGVCKDTSSQSIFFDNLVEANFDVTALVCPDKPAAFVNTTVGRIINYTWNFGNGQSSNLKDPPPQIYMSNTRTDYFAKPQLIVTNDYNCKDTITKNIKVVFSCFVAVPSAFTPNGDGLNDFLYPIGAYSAKDIKFSVYDRFGNLVFSGSSILNKWDGRYKGNEASAGTYVWMLEYIDIETNLPRFLKGTSILIR